MTNKEWLSNKSNKELAKLILTNDCCAHCEYLNYDSCKRKGDDDCAGGIEKWLGEEHKDGAD